MEQTKVNGLNTRGLEINLKKLLNLFSFNADAIHESKDWPYIWRKGSVKSAGKALPAQKDLATRKARSRRLLKISLWGIASLIMYLVLFLNQAAVTKYFTQGGFFALATVGTALSFALVHGTFAGYILENLNYKVANREKDEH
jgi:hypothetical protein